MTAMRPRMVAMAGSVSGALEPPSPPRKLFADYLNARALLAAPPPTLDFAFPGLLTGAIGVLVSPGGTGKSMLAMQMAISVAAGRDIWRLFGAAPLAGPVVIVNAEDPPEILARRLHALRSSAPEAFENGLFLDNLHIKSVSGANFSFGTWDGHRFVMSGDLETLGMEIDQIQPRLACIDTLNRCLSGISENDNAAMGRIISEIEALISTTKAAGLILHHTSKATSLGGQGDHQQAARGASAITDNARFQMNLVGMTEGEAKARDIREDERKQFVRLSVPKCNYSAAIADRWLKREMGGVLRGGWELPPVPSVRRQKAGGRAHDDD